MSRFFISVVPLLIQLGSVRGQCSMSTTILAHNDCEGGSVSVNTSGGSGPYGIAVQRLMLGGAWQSAFLLSNDADGGTYWSMAALDQDWMLSTATRVTVTDVNGCVATDSSQYWPLIVPDYIGPIYVDADCVTGLSTVRMAMGVQNEHPASYTLTPGGSGSFSADWTYEGGIWRFNTQLPNGNYSVYLPEYIVSGNRYCVDQGFFNVDGNVSPGDCGVNFRLRAALDGAYSGGSLMNDGLRTANLIPTNQPYTALGYTFTGSPTNVSVAPTLLAVTGGNAIVDWVVVELRSSLTTVAYSKPALLQRDGDVVDVDGDGYVNFPIAPGLYRVALRHRNHLGVMTNTPQSLAQSPTYALVNFGSSSLATYGTNARVLKNGWQCLWAGDATGNGQLRYTGSANDRDPILLAVGSTTPNNTVPNVYDRRDTNLDGVIKYTGSANDRDIILTNVGSTTPNNTRTQQLP